MRRANLETISPCTSCGSNLAALPPDPNDASHIHCALCDRELGRLGDLRRALKAREDAARRARHIFAWPINPVAGQKGEDRGEMTLANLPFAAGVLA
jgi:hypothetical protein